MMIYNFTNDKLDDVATGTLRMKIRNLGGYLKSRFLL